MVFFQRIINKSEQLECYVIIVESSFGLDKLVNLSEIQSQLSLFKKVTLNVDKNELSLALLLL